MDILHDATAIVAAAERNGVVARIETLLEKYQNGMAMFIISDGDTTNSTIVEAFSNANAGVMLGLMGVIRESIMFTIMNTMHNDDNGKYGNPSGE